MVRCTEYKRGINTALFFAYLVARFVHQVPPSRTNQNAQNVLQRPQFEVTVCETFAQLQCVQSFRFRT